MKLEDFQAMVEGSRAGKVNPGSQNSRTTPGGSMSHPPTAIKTELNILGDFLFPKQNTKEERNVNRTPGDTLSGHFHKRNHAATTCLMSSYQAKHFTYTFI